MTPLPRLQFLTLDAAPLGHVGQARAACAGGVRWVQFRAKGLSHPDWVALAREVAAVCRDHGARFTVNDSPAVAAESGADGVHLGRGDASPSDARTRLGPAALVGVTLNTPADLPRLALGRPDYAGVGPFRATASKPGHAPVHTDASLAALIAAAGLPAYAIGGVTPDDLPRLRALGAHGAAVSGALALAPDPVAATRRLVAAAEAAWPGLS
jgi:thiamine-phosphate pyrophosphorylase